MGRGDHINFQFFGLLLLLFTFYACRGSSTDTDSSPDPNTPNPEVKENNDNTPEIDFDTLQWMEITSENSGIILDIKYATQENFTNAIIYDCPRCFLRPETAEKLIALNKGIMERYNLRIKVFDCYRPRPAQQKLWDIVPNASYVTPPAKGSMHNRGVAVDLTLTDLDGVPLDMGSPYDHFGVEAHTDNVNHSEKVLNNRHLLKTMMNEIDFKGIRTEWWHYSFQQHSYELSDWEWKCPK